MEVRLAQFIFSTTNTRDSLHGTIDSLAAELATVVGHRVTPPTATVVTLINFNRFSQLFRSLHYPVIS